MLGKFTVNALPNDSTLVLLSWLFLGAGELTWILLLSMLGGKENFQFSCIHLQQGVQRINFWDQHDTCLSNIKIKFIVIYAQYT